MKRHAYCIIAHKDIYCLNKLLECIDDSRNDIFLLIDKKSDIDSSEICQPSNSQLFTPPRNVNIYWGDISQIKAELHILEIAKKYGQYDYYHLLSGQDLPLQSQDMIHTFFDNIPKGTNFIGFTSTDKPDASLKPKIEYYIPFIKYLRCTNKYKCYLFDKTRSFVINIQKRFNIQRYDISLFKKGANWVSITEPFVEFLISNKKDILKTYRGVLCPDEIYKQTLLWNSKFRDTIYDSSEEYNGCLREIDWKRGNPYTYRSNDFNTLTSSNKLFARKFDSQVDKFIIDAICDKVKNDKFLHHTD